MNPSNISTQSQPVSSSLAQWMSRHALISFFFLAYTISWLLSIPVILSEWHVLPKNTLTFNVFFVIKSFGPFLAAYILTQILDGKEGWQQLKNRFKLMNVGWKWYAFILLGIPVLMLLGISVLPGALVSFQGFPPHFVITYLVSFIVIFFVGGPLGEEPGWRGFALPRLQVRYGALRGTLLLGVLWTFWHLPDFLTSAQKGGPGTGLYPFYAGLPVFFLEVMALAVIFTWVFNHTRGSIFIALLLHASYNAFSIVLPLFTAQIVTSTDMPFLIATVVPALLIIVLTRGRLGNQPNGEPS
ncbi:MAG TPA: type II CAAX endopeptidase family protein [Anaerolineaceae bacterium]